VGTSWKDNYRSKYTLERMSAAVSAVKNNTKTLREAAKHFQVPVILHYQ
jgi:hypothetical protein